MKKSVEAGKPEEKKKSKKKKKDKKEKPKEPVKTEEVKELTPEERQANAAEAALKRKEGKKQKSAIDEAKAELLKRKDKAGKVKKFQEKDDYDL